MPRADRVLIGLCLFLASGAASISVGVLYRQAGTERKLAELGRTLDERSVAFASQGGSRAPDSATVGANGAASLGSDAAPVTLVYFTDYGCAYCRRFAQEVLPRLRADLLSSSRARLVVRDFPLRPTSIPAGVAARCAGAQGKYWQYHDALFAAPGELDSTALHAAARVARLATPAWTHCLSDSSVAALVRRDGEQALAAGLTGTPAFVIGRTSPAGMVRGKAYIGAPALSGFIESIGRSAGPEAP